MLTARIKIGDGAIQDTRDYGLVYLDSDKRVGPESKGYESTSYPEEEGEHILPKSVDAPFDYTVKFFIRADSVYNANDKIDAFNKSLYTKSGDVKTFKQVAFFNDYKRHKIVGYPFEISEASEFWHDRENQINDVVVVEWKIRVTKPSLCEYKIPFSDDSSD